MKNTGTTNRHQRQAAVATFAILILAAPLHAGPRTSANYNVPADTTDAGGRRTASANYTNDGSAGGVTGISAVAAPAETAKHGYVGQLYDVTGLVVSGASSVNETATLQLSAAQFLDDTTTLAVSATSVTWSVVSGPVTGISLAGLATAGTVFQNAPATVQGAFGGFTGTLNLTVLNTFSDNLGSYAGDGIDDAWQVQYFGPPPNANAGPDVDFSRTGQTNFFKYVAGLNPLDPNAVFTVKIIPVTGLSTVKQLVFTPLVAGRSYTVKFRPDLAAGTWISLTGAFQNDSGATRTVTDLNATEDMKYYRVEITKP